MNDETPTRIPLGTARLTTRKIKHDVPPAIPGVTFEAVAGRGGMSVVWRAWHEGLHRRVAVKVLSKDFSSSGKDVRQFMGEVRMMESIDHPGIVHGYGADVVDGRYYYIMDFVDGYTFAQLLGRKGRVPYEDVLIVAESVADAMNFAWRKFQTVHCDIKPDNIMVDADGSIKLTDLGLCQSANLLRTTSLPEDEIIGTPAYMSPDQIYADQPLDARADIYCLGATLYHLLTGHTLFKSEDNDAILRAHVDPASRAADPRDFVPTVPGDFARCLAKMLVKERDGRYADWDALIGDLVAIEEGRPVLPPPPGVVSSIQLRPED